MTVMLPRLSSLSITLPISAILDPMFVIATPAKAGASNPVRIATSLRSSQ
jgi:hypothetical protein